MPYLLPSPGTAGKRSVASGEANGVAREIKEWQAIVDHLRRMPVMSPGELPRIPIDERATEVRAIRAG
jgi:5'-nucleotidase